MSPTREIRFPDHRCDSGTHFYEMFLTADDIYRKVVYCRTELVKQLGLRKT